MRVAGAVARRGASFDRSRVFRSFFMVLGAMLSGAVNAGWSIEQLPPHPRLLLTPAREAALRAALPDDPFLRELAEHLQRAAELALAEPLPRHVLVGPRLLSEARACLARTTTLALAYRLSADRRYLDRAVAEMRAAAALPDWNPSHFLDVAEFAAALALGYDWLHDALDEADRALVRTALIEKALQPGWDERYIGFATRENNWNPVCHGGLSLAALAVGSHAPELVARTLERARTELPRVLAGYAPDGAWYEGPGYWRYGTTYLAMLLDAWGTALGTDFGLGDAPGLSNTARFFAQALGPTNKLFNYADSGVRPGASPTLFWLAQRYGDPEAAAFERALLERWFGLLRRRAHERTPEVDPEELRLGNEEYADLLYSNRFFALALVWYPHGQPPGARAALGSQSFRGVVDVAFLRAGDGGPRSAYVGLKGGRHRVPHAHLDAGSFVYDALGTRWASDLGTDNYDLPGYWDRDDDAQRWRYFRLGSLSHNVVTIDGLNQRVDGVASIVSFIEGDATSREPARAIVDLTAKYAGQAVTARRGFALGAAGDLLVQDELVGAPGRSGLRWAMLTFATVALDGRRASLRRDGETLVAHLLAPAGATFTLESAAPPTPVERPNDGASLLTVRAPLFPAEPVRVAVWLTPVPEIAPPQPRPLDEW